MAIYIVMDLVLNHSSDEHKWFIEAAKRAGKILIMITMYGVMEKREYVPNDMKAAFGGSAWEWVPGIRTILFPSVFCETAGSELGESEAETGAVGYH